MVWIAILAVALAPFLMACGGSDSPSGPATGTLAVEMKDAPIDEVSEINVYIVGLTVKPVDGPVDVIASEIGLVDLLELQTTTELLAVVNLEPGAYTFIQVDLDQDRSNVVEIDSGLEQPLQIPSEEIKVVGGGFEVFPGDTTRLTLDFDANRSLLKLGNGDWLLEPLILLENVVIEE
ncbi:MAG: DUF4382 domain-containing protein [Thermoanaerobaculia bacterium]|nr:DUF4382 domain-containing protein [Thermoanaerobaculia bacterium]